MLQKREREREGRKEMMNVYCIDNGSEGDKICRRKSGARRKGNLSLPNKNLGKSSKLIGGTR